MFLTREFFILTCGEPTIVRSFASNCNLGVNIGASYLSAGLCDLHFRGLMRVEMQPLLPRAPFFGALAVSFVHDPVSCTTVLWA